MAPAVCMTAVCLETRNSTFRDPVESKKLGVIPVTQWRSICATLSGATRHGRSTEKQRSRSDPS